MIGRRSSFAPGPHAGIAPRAVALALALLCAIWLYAPTLGIGFLSDDFARIAEVRDTLRADPGALFLRAGSDGYYRPLFSLSLAMDAALWGLDPAGFHLTNVLLHLGVLLLALRLVSRTLCAGLGTVHARYLLIAGAPALALYPHHVDAVAWISGRSELLVALFSLACLDRFLAGGRAATAAALAFLFLALLSKESAFALPLVLLAAHASISPRRGWRVLTPYFALPFALGLFRLAWLGRAGFERLSTPARWPAHGVASIFRLLFPVDGEWLHAWSHLLARSWAGTPWLALALGAMLLVLFLGLALRAARLRPVIARGLVFAALLVVLPALRGVEARYLYLPSLGAVLALVALGLAFLPARAIAGAAERGVAWRWAAALVFAGALVAAYAWGAVDRRGAWLEASRVSRRMLDDLAAHARAEPGRSMALIASPFSLRGASIAADWGRALSLTYGIRADIHVLDTVRIPDAIWPGPSVQVQGPDDFVLALDPDSHTGFQFPGDALGAADRVHLRGAVVTVTRRDALGRAARLRLTLEPDSGAPPPLVLVWRDGSVTRVSPDEP